MNSLPVQYQHIVSKLTEACLSGKLGHNNPRKCAVTHLLGDDLGWMDAISPSGGTIDHQVKFNQPRVFAAGLRAAQHPSLSLEEIIRIEAAFEGRIKNCEGLYLATLDDENDPDGALGLSNVIQYLQQIARKKPSPAKVPDFISA